jgi:Flp pilus assembly protein TadD
MSGSIEVLPEIENELAWQILSRTGINNIYSREEYRGRARTVPNSAFSYYVKSLFAADEEAKARLLTRALELHPDFPDVLFLMGRHFYRKSDCKRAIGNLESVRSRSPDFPDSQFMLATCHFRDGAYARSAYALRSILPQTQAMEVLNNLGVAYIWLGDWPRASQALTQARRIAHSHPIPAVNQAIAEFLRGNSRIALEILYDAIRVSPGDGLLHMVAVAIHHALGETDKGEKATEQARRLGIDTDKLKSQKPQSWAPWFDTWDSSP